VAAVSNSRGAATLFVDAGEAEGLELAGPGIADLGPLATPEAYEEAVRASLEHDDVDAVFVSFACVGDCTPDPVGRAVRRAALRAQRATGVAKPVLLCLMGRVGAIRPRPATQQGEEREAFPAYRFPEEAAHALGRVVRYTRYRQRKPGVLVWYDDVDSSAARQRVQSLLAEVEDASSVTVPGETAAVLAADFGLACTDTHPGDGQPLRLSVRTDAHFGPLIELRRGEGLLAVRLTPLSDRDVAETVAAVGLPERWDSDELLGRVSQMIEELPWLHAMHATVVVGEAEGSVGLASDLSIELRPSGAIERARQL
jgi:acyl-CoA synthetase (NDP forming)